MINVAKSIKLKEELDSLRPLKKEDELRIMQKFRLDWNYHSNHLEGNSLTYGETKALILFGITAQGKPLKDHFEITGHNEAINWIIDIVKQERPLSENFIRELHTLILKESYEKDAITPEGKPTKKKIKVGVYKTTPNHVKTKTGEIFRFATPEETPAKMHDFINWYIDKMEAKDTVNPILLAAEFHYKFIRIHPFDDGNGRTARILMNFILMQFGYPPIIIKTEDKENYFAALKQADAGLLEPFIEYLAENLNHSLEIMIKGAKGESVEEADDLEKELALLEQKLKAATNTLPLPKSKEIILSLFDDSVTKTAKIFKEKGKLFEKFYFNKNAFISISSYSEKIENIQLIRNLVHENFRNVIIRYNYKSFNREHFREFDHISQIEFQFNQNDYIVKTLGNIEIKKSYKEQLNEEEIITLVNSEMKRHQQAIEEKIEEIKQKK